MNIEPIAYFHSPFTEKFGIPRQSGLVDELTGEIVFVKEWQTAEAIRGLEDFDYLWIIWEFSANREARKTPTVRPPRLGGNERMGVFATRSPFRPNNLGLSSVRIVSIETSTARGPVIRVAGADLMDGTPIYDIKPYLPSADSHPEAAERRHTARAGQLVHRRAAARPHPNPGARPTTPLSGRSRPHLWPDVRRPRHTLPRQRRPVGSVVKHSFVCIQAVSALSEDGFSFVCILLLCCHFSEIVKQSHLDYRAISLRLQGNFAEMADE